MTSTIAATKARVIFAEIVRRVGYQGERVAISHYGRVIAVLVPAHEANLEMPSRKGRAPNGRGAR
jgi:prevent-host-death family protein